MNQQHDQAMTAAAEYRRLVAEGRHVEADEVRRTIDELVGRWRWVSSLDVPGRCEFVWCWPTDVAVAAGRDLVATVGKY